LDAFGSDESDESDKSDKSDKSDGSDESVRIADAVRGLVDR
jgi:hypothetical protein